MKTFTDNLVALINKSTLSTEKFETVDDLTRREDTEFDYIVPKRYFKYLNPLINESKPAETIYLYHQYKLNGKPKRITIELACAFVTDICWLNEGWYKFTIKGTVIKVMGGTMIEYERKNHYMPHPAYKLKPWMPAPEVRYGFTERIVYTLRDITIPNNIKKVIRIIDESQ